tara:strand:+ start:4158 stop:4277 length:120 start_codon:yes stop_codon:yes gene_type:complete
MNQSQMTLQYYNAANEQGWQRKLSKQDEDHTIGMSDVRA